MPELQALGHDQAAAYRGRGLMDAAWLPVAAAVAAVSAMFTAAWIGVARRWQVQDLPGQRRLHSTPTPRGGGIAIALAWLPVLFACTRSAGAPAGAAWFGWLVLAFAALGLADDLGARLGAAGKLLLQGLLAFGLVRALCVGASPSPWLLLGATFAGTALVNAWNFMDGSNGMVALQTAVISVALGLWPGQAPVVAYASFALAAACLGFLPFNLPRARVFLGDVGSHVLGAAVFLLLGWSLQAGCLSWLQALLLCTPFLLDCGLTLARRILRGRRFWQAHREHLFQYAVRKGHSHARVALAYALATALLALLAAQLPGNRPGQGAVLILCAIWLAGAVLYVGLRRRWLGRTMRGGGHR
jgi:UDP-N-acetylmuramyl pentapeptide phosphotransferase/UDP-N-acetylglucosamine-1-phosphate transferase